MSQKKRSGRPVSPANEQAYDRKMREEQAERQAAAEQRMVQAQERIDAAREAAADRASTLNEALEIVQQARDLEVSRGRTAALPEGCFALQRLLIAVLESMTPEQRAEVKRRLG